MRNKYPGHCYICGRPMKKGEGWFQSKGTLSVLQRRSYQGKWILRCTGCKGLGNKPLEEIKS